MLRLFQVNEGRFVDVEVELTPNSRVGDVCESVRREGGRREGGGVVLMVADGQQMEDSELVGGYSPGMEGKPIFVFYQKYLSLSSPPVLHSLLKPRPELERGLGILHQKPYPGLFQKLPPLAKQLSDYSSALYNIYQSVREETELQISGWNAVLRNCRQIIGVYEKHQQHFSKFLESFQSSRPHYLQLVNSFPEQVKLLRQLPVPAKTAASSHSSSSSLYDWISTHDEKNSLVDLCSECEKTLAQTEEGQMTSALETSKTLLALCGLEGLAIRGEGERGGGAARAAELAQLQIRMMENIYSTSQKAMRSGDGGTIADLTVSHYKTLQLMNQQRRELEGLVRAAETRKSMIMQHIHQGLRVVTELQMKINESNSVLVFLHETLKLAKKRFEVLEQVCSCGEVLGDIVAEVERRESFNHLFTERVVEVSEELRTVREDEKQRRHTFTTSHRQHFLTSLFSQLSHRLLDATCRLGRVPVSGDTSDLSHIKRSLPPELLRQVTVADSFSTLLSQSLTGPSALDHTPPRTSSYPQLKPRPLATPTSVTTPLPAASHAGDSVEVEKLLVEASQPELADEKEKQEEEQGKADKVKKRPEFEDQKTATEKFECKIQELEERLANVSEERDLLARKVGEVRDVSLESAGFEIVEKQNFSISEKEYSDKVQSLETQLEVVNVERECLLKEREADRENRETSDSHEKEKNKLTKKLQESLDLQESLAKSLEVLQQKERDLEKIVQEMQEGVAEKEREREEERARFATREAELVNAVEEEKRRAAEQCEELLGNISNLRIRLQTADRTISEQKMALATQTTELETANEAREKLSEKCHDLQDGLDKKSAEMDSVKQCNMQWRAESQERNHENETLRTKNEELGNELVAFRDMCDQLTSEKDQLVKEREHEKHNLQEKNEALRTTVQRLEYESKYLKTYSGGFSEGARSLSSGEMTSSEQLQSDSSSTMSSNPRWLTGTQTCQADVTQMKTENEKLKPENAALQTRNDEVQLKITQFESEVGEREREISQLKSEIDTLKSRNVGLTSKLQLESKKHSSEVAEKDREISAQRSKMTEYESETEEMNRKCEQLSSKLSEAEERYWRCHDQSERELAVSAAQLSSENKRLQSQSRDQQLRIDELNSEFEKLRTEHGELGQKLAESERKSEELEQKSAESERKYAELEQKYAESERENQKLRTERDEMVETLRERIRVADDSSHIVASCTKCQTHLQEVTELRKSLEEKEEELKRSEYRHQQAQKAYTSTRAQQEALRSRLVALEEERKREDVSKVGVVRGREGGGRGEGETGEVEGGWVMEGEGGGGGERDPQEEIRRLRTELAVERKNRSVVAEELQKVARERDKFMQKFMETERELRNRCRQQQQVMSESVMAPSGSSVGGRGGGQWGLWYWQ